MKIGADADPQARLCFPSSSRRWRVNARVVLQPRRRGVCCDDKVPSIIYFGKDVGITVADLESQSKKVSDDSIDKIINYTLGSVYLQMSILEGIENERLEEKMLEMIKERSSDLRTSLANDIGSRRNPEIGQSWRVNLRKLSKPSK